MIPSLLSVERLPWTNGVLLAVNAIPRVAAIIDGPFCVAHKAETQLAHDLSSDLLGVGAASRALFTLRRDRIEEVAQIALDRVAAVEAVFDEALGPPDREGAVCTSFDFIQLAEFPLDAIARGAAERHGKPVIHVPSRSLEGDWLVGYEATCDALAAQLPLPALPQPAGSVAIVGHLHDRAEGDQRANLAELTRLLAGIGLSLSSVWLSGRGWTELAQAAAAEVIVSLPHARKAASRLARRTGARLVEAGLPLGLEATASFVAEVAAAFGREARASSFIDQELRSAVTDTRVHVQRLVAGRSARLCNNDPHLSLALRVFCDEVGLDVLSEEGYLAIQRTEAERAAGGEERPEGGVVLFADRNPAEREPDVGFVPVGYPACRYHPLVDRPYLGFAGFRHLVDRVADAFLAASA